MQSIYLQKIPLQPHTATHANERIFTQRHCQVHVLTHKHKTHTGIVFLQMQFKKFHWPTNFKKRSFTLQFL